MTGLAYSIWWQWDETSRGTQVGPSVGKLKGDIQVTAPADESAIGALKLHCRPSLEHQSDRYLCRDSTDEDCTSVLHDDSITIQSHARRSRPAGIRCGVGGVRMFAITRKRRGCLDEW